MGKYVNNNIVNLGVYGSAIDYDDAVKEIASLLGVGKRNDGKYHLADICQANSINPLARYKPERNTKEANLTDADREANVFGFGETPIIEPYTAGISHATYEYKKPRGGTVSPVEWNRLRDFHGYNHAAVASFQPYFPDTIGREDYNIIYCMANSSDIASGWDATSCLLLEDMVDETTKSYNVGLLAHRGNRLWLMPSDIRISDLSVLNFPIFMFARSESELEQMDSTNVFKYVLSDLNSAEGDSYTFALVATSMGYQTDKLPITQDEGIPTMRSLEFTYGNDRRTMEVVTTQSIADITGSLATSSWNYTMEADPSGMGGMGVIKFDESQKLTVRVTAPSSWRRSTVYINVQMINEGGAMYHEGTMMEVPMVNIGNDISLSAGETREVDILSFAYPNRYWFQYATSAHRGGILFIITAYRNSSMTGESVELQSISVTLPEK